MRTGVRFGITFCAALLVGVIGVTNAWSGEVTFVSQGGAYQEAQTKAILDPAAKALGITIKQDSSADAYPVIKTQVQAGKVYWDLNDMAAAYCVRGIKEGLFEKLDYSLIPNAKDLDPQFRNDFYTGYITYSTVLAYSTERFGSNAPKTWADFWDVKKFPGRRSLRNNAKPSLEAALLADGVPANKLYPLDVDRAYKKLEQIKPHINVWWTSGGQSTQLLRDGEVDMIGLWNGRAGAAINAGAKAVYHYNQGILEYTCLSVLKGSPNKVNAMKLLNEAIKAENQARLPLLIDYGPINLKAFDSGVIPANVAEKLPTSPKNYASQALLSPDWWATPEGVQAEQRWLKFVQ
jgi:putative spermidine/putrescine transport system substrate-binding protein